MIRLLFNELGQATVGMSTTKLGTVNKLVYEDRKTNKMQQLDVY